MPIPSSFNRIHIPKNKGAIRPAYSAVHPAEIELAEKKALPPLSANDRAQIFLTWLFKFDKLYVIEPDGSLATVTPKWVSRLFLESDTCAETYRMWVRKMQAARKNGRKRFCFPRSYLTAMQQRSSEAAR